MSDPRRTEAIPEVPGVLTTSEIIDTARSIITQQKPNGMILWADGHHCDPWNHVEALMALDATGFSVEADLGYRWLEATQLGDGSWFNYYIADGVKDVRLDTNVCAYVAAGVWHSYLLTGDTDAMARRFAMVARALDFVVRWQLDSGAIRWSLDPAGRLESYALLTGSSSIYHSLRCGVAIAERLEIARPDWELAAGRLGHAIAHHPSAFAPKVEFAMDWYYPILGGAIEGDAGRVRIEQSWDAFVMDGLGVRCVSTGDWVTAAETAECVMALDALGMTDRALDLFTWAQGHRRDDGSYWTGLVHPERITYPDLERTTYTAGAIILAADALSGATPASGLFRGETLPVAIDLAESTCVNLADCAEDN